MAQMIGVAESAVREALKRLGDARTGGPVRTNKGANGFEYRIEGDRDALLVRAGLMKPTLRLVAGSLRPEPAQIFSQLRDEIDGTDRAAFNDDRAISAAFDATGVSVDQAMQYAQGLREFLAALNIYHGA
jgi:hypothetical protein